MDLIKSFFKLITFFGSIYFFILFLILMFFVDKFKILSLLLSFVIGLFIVVVIRILYFKERPDKSKTNNLWLRIYNSSFPSVHAMRAILLAYFLSVLYFNMFLILFWLFALIICYSRIYLKKHYFIDVFVGALIGLLLSIIML